MEDTMKTCKRCETSLPLDSFHKHSGFKDGRRTICKNCANAESRKYYKENRDSHLDSCRDWQKRNPEKLKQYQDKHRSKRRSNSVLWRQRYPERIRAQKKLNYAVFKGEVERCEKCQICGCGDVKTEAHHFDYDKPLEVIWVCTACHGWIHRKHAQREVVNA